MEATTFPGQDITTIEDNANQTWSNDSDKFLFGTDLYFHPHWQTYSDTIFGIPDYIHYVLGIYIGVVGIIGTLGNALVIYIFATTKSLRTPPNMFIINLAISDLGFSAVNGFPLMTVSCFMKHWSWGMLACEFYGFLGGIFGFNSINTLAWISLDRYYVIAYPFEAMRKCTHKRALMQIIFVWFWAALWAVPPFLGWGRYIPEGLHTSCSFDYLSQDISTVSYVWSMFVGGFVFPVIMIFVCYINIIRAVSNQAKSMAKTAEKMKATEKDSKKRRQEIELAKIAAVTISLFLVSWLPYAVITLLGISGYKNFVTPYTCQIPVMFAKASAMWNPMMYALNHPKFRAVLEEKFPWLLFCKDRAIDKDDDKDDEEPKKKTGRKSQDIESEVSSEVSVMETSINEPSRICASPNPNGQQRFSAQVHQQHQGFQQNSNGYVNQQLYGYENPAFQGDQQGLRPPMNGQNPMMLNPQNFQYGGYPAQAMPMMPMCPVPAYCPYPPPGYPPYYPPPHGYDRRRRRSDSDEDEYDFRDRRSNRRQEVATQSSTKENDQSPGVTLISRSDEEAAKSGSGAAENKSNENVNNNAGQASSLSVDNEAITVDIAENKKEVVESIGEAATEVISEVSHVANDPKLPEPESELTDTKPETKSESECMSTPEPVPKEPNISDEKENISENRTDDKQENPSPEHKTDEHINDETDTKETTEPEVSSSTIKDCEENASSQAPEQVQPVLVKQPSVEYQDDDCV